MLVLIIMSDVLWLHHGQFGSYVDDVFISVRDVSIRAEQVEKDFFFEGNEIKNTECE